MARRGVDIGTVNYQDMGNWGVFKPEGPTLHMQIYGRARTDIERLLQSKKYKDPWNEA